MSAPLHLARDHWQFDRAAYRAASLAPALRWLPVIIGAAFLLGALVALFLAVQP